MKRKTTAVEEQVLLFLNDLRESGVTNMFGARPYIVEQFPEHGFDNKEAQRLLKLWMHNFNDEGSYGEVDDGL